MDTSTDLPRMTEEDGVIAAARARAIAADVDPPSAEVGALLAWAATTVGARTAVEVGSAGGVSSLWILQALPVKGVLTSIEPDPHVHRLTEQATADIDANGNVRTILGDAATVLPRLADGGYDLMLVQGRNASAKALSHAARLLKPGGMLLCRGLDQTQQHTFVPALADDPAFVGTALPFDGSLTIATRVEPTDD